MEYKHFSHNHGLAYHQLQPGSQVQCSGCKTSGSGNVYVCWQCSYFLHDRCYHATRSLRTPSHPQHPLTLVPYPTHSSNTFFCNSCNLVGTGFSYCCASCDFDLHVHCATPPYPASNPMSFPSHKPIPNDPFPNYPNHHSFNPAQSSQFSTYPNSSPYGIPNHATPSAPPYVPSSQQNPQSQPAFNHPTAAASPVNPPTPQPPQPNPTLPIYTPPTSSITVSSPPPPPQPLQPGPPLPTSSTASSNPPAPISQPIPDQSSQSNSMIKHFSHPHVLLRMEIDKKNAKVCSACECALSGSAYCCTEAYCTFNLHQACFDSPLEVRHKCHLDHCLKLLTTPPYKDGFTCNACLKDGKAFAYHCEACSYDLHIDCITWPETVTRSDHKHVLNLYYSSPAANSNQESVFACDVCKNPVHEMAWMYYCRECDYGTHLECVASGLLPSLDLGQTDEELLQETQLKFAVLQLLLNQGLSGAKK